MSADDNDQPSGAADHRRLGVEAFNASWEILGRPLGECSDDDLVELTTRAYASAYHWARADGRGAEHDARAHWLLSRVWAVRGQGALSLDHAQRCYDLCQAHGLADFDLAYAHEALARAHACLGDRGAALEHRERALAVPVADADDARLVKSDVENGPWFLLES